MSKTDILKLHDIASNLTTIFFLSFSFTRNICLSEFLSLLLYHAMTIPLFHPQKACATHHDTQTLETIAAVKHIYNNRPYLTELQFIPVLKACRLPRYMNMAFFRKLEVIGNVDQLVPFAAFVEYVKFVRKP